jgi:hypothetical protein
MRFNALLLDLECGNDQSSVSSVLLRWSSDRGRTWNEGVMQSTGAFGEFLTEPQWRALGIARDMVFEVEYTSNGEAALQGAWVETTVLNS